MKQLNAKEDRRKKFPVVAVEELGRFEAAGGFWTTSLARRPADQRRPCWTGFFRSEGRALQASLGLPDVFADSRNADLPAQGLIDKPDDTGQTTPGLQMHCDPPQGRARGARSPRYPVYRARATTSSASSARSTKSIAPDASPGEFLYWQTISGLHGKGVTSCFDFGLVATRSPSVPGRRSKRRITTWCCRCRFVRQRSPALAHRARHPRARPTSRRGPALYKFAQRVSGTDRLIVRSRQRGPAECPAPAPLAARHQHDALIARRLEFRHQRRRTSSPIDLRQREDDLDVPAAPRSAATPATSAAPHSTTTRS